MNETTDHALHDGAFEESAQHAAAFATECDLVMKGGITSGIIYPLAITEIAKAFRLRSIGGTSAGAIAAAAAAAAETGRRRFVNGLISRDPDGFGKLERLPEHLAAPAANGTGTKLLAFFKPAPALQPVFTVLLAALGSKTMSGRVRSIIAALVGRYKIVALVGFALGTVPLWLLELNRWTLMAWIWIIAFAALLAIGLASWRFVRTLLVELSANRFGICSGMPPPDDCAPEEALSEWLAKYFDDLAGQDQAFPKDNKPLTFGDLKAQGVELMVMTTCLTMGRPFRLPFGDDEFVRENNLFVYKTAEFEELFPRNVVRWMELHERPYERAGDGKGRFDNIDFAGYKSLPVPDDLPVVVAVRMSLSFPILLSAIPLYSIDMRKPAMPGETPERCWFTDGGVGANFPIHFFDAPLPTRPTFGLDLGLATNPDAPRVVFPRTNGDARLAYWRRFDEGDGFGAIAGFLGSIINVAKDWNHEALSHMPGFRDRIGLIRLTEDEGGLNLTMPAERIKRLTGYGRDVGREFVSRFGSPAMRTTGLTLSTMNWENHQLVRLRLLLSSVSEMAAGLEKTIAATSGTPQDYGRFFDTKVGPSSYRFTGLGALNVDPSNGLHTTQSGLAHWLLGELVAIAKRIAATIRKHPPPTRVRLMDGAPKPAPELKLRPRI